VKRSTLLFALLILTTALGILERPVRAQRLVAGEAEMRLALERLNTLGSVMMIGAHPDDERETVLAYLALGRHVRASYLSLTRGEGGQNLIGSEQGDELGIIRTEELLSSRRIDGAEQYFSRAIDFGFSKTADETLTKWPREKVLADVVWNIRRFRPDVVVLVFSGTTRDGHGHHQASSILGKEAYFAAGDSSKFPEQLAYVQPWKAKRLMMNAGFGQQQQNADQTKDGQAKEGQAKQKGKGQGKAAAPLPDLFPPNERLDLEVGDYSPALGYSYGEIGAISRNANRSQGTGAAERKGSQKNPLGTVDGDRARTDIFEGIDITWSRVAGGSEVKAVLQQALDSYSPAHPEALVPILAKARPLIAAIRDPWAERKLVEVDEAIGLASGLWVEAQSDKFNVTPGGSLKLTLSAVSRLPVQATLTGIRVTGMDGVPPLNMAPTVLVNNQPSQFPLNVKVPENQPYSQPYWLQQPKDGPLYAIPDQKLVGNPENAPPLEAHFTLRIAGVDVEITRPVEHRFVDRVLGERVRPLAVVPPVSVEPTDQSLLFATQAPRKFDVPVRSNNGKVSGDVRLELPSGWRAEPAMRHFDLASTDEQTTLSFDIAPPAGDARGKVRAVAQVGNFAVSSGTEVLQYPHIMTQTLFPMADASLVRTEIKVLAKKVGYVMGAGDEVPTALEQLGCEVTLLTPAELARGDLSKYDAIVTGVRAFNTRPDLRANHQRLWDYASTGGTVIVQYNNAQGQGDRTLLEHMGPYPIRPSNLRVTVEEAPITFPNPQLSVLNTPNKITPADFEGWVQERGLYFADEWDPKYASVLESHDPGEDPLPGGMLYARVGKGAYIFSAYAWFRQLPAGVPGAYRLFANMLSAAKAQ
jgi:LmbE family N-acetylglucosaminyl deacetylase